MIISPEEAEVVILQFLMPIQEVVMVVEREEIQDL